MMSQEIRRKFLKYFKEKGHTVIPSSPVVPHDDPTLLFVNAGMNQFKDVFLDKSIRDYSRATSSQKCIRVGGKHNDLENVGHTARHLTFFEMLGNFSFGDYFKKEAIDFAWDVTLKIFGYDPEFIWASVYKDDDEAFELWTKYLPVKKIVRLGEKDNFWAMGDTGPCGPCSELYYDRGRSFGSASTIIEDTKGDRFIEFWNLVFMQYYRDASGDLHTLPKKSVDTGAGLERVLALKGGFLSVFETDVLRSLIAEVENLTHIPYNPRDLITAPDFHVIADHIRSLAFAIVDGVQPSNVERGYVLRKILRRAVRYGRQLGMQEPFLAQLLPRLVKLMGDDYPELKTSETLIAETVMREEENFLRTLKRGGNLLNEIIAKSHDKQNQISGEDAFKLKDTYGLPLEEILLLAKDAGLTVDLARFEQLELEAKERSKGARKATHQKLSDSFFTEFVKKYGPTEFVGYTDLSSESQILAILVDDQEVSVLLPGEKGVILLDRSPFYAEKGGQIGDHGIIAAEHGQFTVMDCQSPFTGVIAHIGLVKEGEIHVGETITASVDALRRQKIANNHTATHLLHWALRQVLGDHVRQAGSVVEPQRLRFDFTHHKPVSLEEIRILEDLVNHQVRENRPVNVYEISYEEAQTKKEIKQFFGEKYGSKVRVIDIEESKELCGGTHAAFCGNIGYFRIIKESSIASGIRRIEAATGEEAESFARESEIFIANLAELLKVQPSHLKDRIEKLMEENRIVLTELAERKREVLELEVESLLAHIEKIQGVSTILKEVPLNPKELRECAEALFKKEKSLIVLLVAKEDDHCSLFAKISGDLIQRGFKASELIKKISPIVGGKGGGKDDSAQAGGTIPQKIPDAISKAREWVLELCTKKS